VAGSDGRCSDRKEAGLPHLGQGVKGVGEGAELGWAHKPLIFRAAVLYIRVLVSGCTVARFLRTPAAGTGVFLPKFPRVFPKMRANTPAGTFPAGTAMS
jgi:hypothetical protein